MAKPSQKGIAHLALLALVLVVAVIGYAGYKVAKSHQKTPIAAQAATVAATSIKTISTQADLQQAETQVSGSNVDNDLNPDSLNDDVTSLL